MKLVELVRKHWIVLTSAFVLFFGIGIPLLINYSYQITPLLITKWDAADVLGYYGDVLGAVVTVGVLAITIIWEKETARQQAHLDQQKENWKRTEDKIDAALNMINPTRLVRICNNSILDLNGLSTEGVTRVYSELNNYIGEVRSCVDTLRVHVEASEDGRVADLVETISNTAEQCLDIGKDLLGTIQTSYINQCIVTNMSTSEGMQDGDKAKCNMLNTMELARKLTNAIERLNDLHKHEYCNRMKEKTVCFVELYSGLASKY